MTIAELIELLKGFNPDTTVVIELDDDYHHVAEVDGAILLDPAAKNPRWDFECESGWTNAVRICV